MGAESVSATSPGGVLLPPGKYAHQILEGKFNALAQESTAALHSKPEGEKVSLLVVHEKGKGRGIEEIIVDVLSSDDKTGGESTPEPTGSHSFNPDTYVEALQRGDINDVPGGLKDVVVLFGSTHGYALWRNLVIPELNTAGVASFNPVLPSTISYDYDKHGPVESRALREASVAVFRIENILDEKLSMQNEGSAASVAETGIAAVYAALQGKRVIISIQEDIRDTFADPGAIAQFEAFLKGIDDLQMLIPGLITVHEGNDLNALSTEIIKAAKQIREGDRADLKSIPSSVDDKLEGMKLKLLPDVVVGGSSAPFAGAAKDDFQALRDSVASSFNTKFYNVEVLNRGSIADEWDELYEVMQQPRYDDIAVTKQLRNLFSKEKGLKDAAEFLFWIVTRDARSDAAVEEAGFRLLYSLKSPGQIMHIHFEEFDADGFLFEQIRKNADGLRRYSGVMRQSVTQAPGANKELIVKTADDIESMLEAVEQGKREDITFKRVKDNRFLRMTGIFGQADRTRRTRGLIGKHLQELDAYQKQQGKQWFVLTTLREDLMNAAKRYGHGH